MFINLMELDYEGAEITGLLPSTAKSNNIFYYNGEN